MGKSKNDGKCKDHRGTRKLREIALHGDREAGEKRNERKR